MEKNRDNTTPPQITDTSVEQSESASTQNATIERDLNSDQTTKLDSASTLKAATSVATWIRSKISTLFCAKASTIPYDSASDPQHTQHTSTPLNEIQQTKANRKTDNEMSMDELLETIIIKRLKYMGNDEQEIRATLVSAFGQRANKILSKILKEKRNKIRQFALVENLQFPNLYDIDENSTDEEILRALKNTAFWQLKENILNNAYIDHMEFNFAIAYAVQNDLFTKKQIQAIKMDHDKTLSEFCASVLPKNDILAFTRNYCQKHKQQIHQISAHITDHCCACPDCD